MILHDAIAPAGGQAHLFRQVASLDTIDAHNGQCFSISVVAATSSDIVLLSVCFVFASNVRVVVVVVIESFRVNQNRRPTVDLYEPHA